MEHRSQTEHSCEVAGPVNVRRSILRLTPQRIAPVCPLCNETLAAGTNANVDQLVDEHINKGCPKRAKGHSNKCSAPGCKNFELVPVVCKFCRKKFCLALRL